MSIQGVNPSHNQIIREVASSTATGGAKQAESVTSKTEPKGTPEPKGESPKAQTSTTTQTVSHRVEVHLHHAMKKPVNDHRVKGHNFSHIKGGIQKLHRGTKDGVSKASQLMAESMGHEEYIDANEGTGNEEKGNDGKGGGGRDQHQTIAMMKSHKIGLESVKESSVPEQAHNTETSKETGKETSKLSIGQTQQSATKTTTEQTKPSQKMISPDSDHHQIMKNSLHTHGMNVHRARTLHFQSLHASIHDAISKIHKQKPSGSKKDDVLSSESAREGMTELEETAIKTSGEKGKGDSDGSSNPQKDHQEVISQLKEKFGADSKPVQALSGDDFSKISETNKSTMVSFSKAETTKPIIFDKTDIVASKESMSASYGKVNLKISSSSKIISKSATKSSFKATMSIGSDISCKIKTINITKNNKTVLASDKLLGSNITIKVKKDISPETLQSHKDSIMDTFKSVNAEISKNQNPDKLSQMKATLLNFKDSVSHALQGIHQALNDVVSQPDFQDLMMMLPIFNPNVTSFMGVESKLNIQLQELGSSNNWSNVSSSASGQTTYVNSTPLILLNKTHLGQ